MTYGYNDQMTLDEAITLFLRASFVTDPEDETCRRSAMHIVETLGCLALAIVHAGATRRQGVCTLDSYCTEYYCHRKRLLDRRPVQAATDYEYTVCSTWEVSIEKITCLLNETARYAIELLNFFSVLHFENITEKILEKAGESLRNTISQPGKSHIFCHSQFSSAQRTGMHNRSEKPLVFCHHIPSFILMDLKIKYPCILSSIHGLEIDCHYRIEANAILRAFSHSRGRWLWTQKMHMLSKLKNTLIPASIFVNASFA